MAVDPTVLAAIERAVAEEPDNHALRAHLAALLLDAGRPHEALDHAAGVLTARPDDLAALRVAARAARATGADDRAERYERLLAALGGEPGTGAPEPEPDEPAPDEAVPATAVPVGGPESIEGEDELDAFLREVLAEGERSRVTLADVGGLEDVKRRLETSFLAPLRNRRLREMYGASLRGGLLLYGPPGCGKTFLARAVAGELGARFIAVGLHDVLDMWLGQSEKNLHEVFEQARRLAPSVLFLDEVDALGQKRSHLTHSAGRNVVVQLLHELDSTRDDNEGVFVLGATNAPWDLDAALRRPGRFDRTLLVLPPDAAARAAILEYHLRDRPVGRLDLGRLGRQTEGFSGADLRLLCQAATELALRDSIESGVESPIEMRHFEATARDVRPSTRPWFETARNYAMFANEGGEYDDLLAYMRAHRLA